MRGEGESPKRPPQNITVEEIMSFLVSLKFRKRLPREPCQAERGNLESEGVPRQSSLISFIKWLAFNDELNLPTKSIKSYDKKAAQTSQIDTLRVKNEAPEADKMPTNQINYMKGVAASWGHDQRPRLFSS